MLKLVNLVVLAILLIFQILGIIRHRVLARSSVFGLMSPEWHRRQRWLYRSFWIVGSITLILLVVRIILPG